MKKIALFFAVTVLLSSVLTTLGQDLTTKAGPASSSPAASAAGGKVPVPPEKAVPINIPKIAVPIAIDGRPDEEAWKNAAVFKDFYQTGPGYNTAPSRPTEVYMMYDEHFL